MTRDELIEETKRRNLRLPPEVRAVFDPLETEFLHLQGKWQILQAIYGDPEAVKIMNKASARYFGIANVQLANDIILSLCRITDPAKTANKDNLTLEQLAQSIPVDDPDDDALRELLQREIASVKTLMKPLRDHRNRRISHSDHSTITNTHPDPLSGVELETLSTLMKQITDFLNEITDHYMSIKSHYGNVGIAEDFKMMIEYLRAGIKCKEEQGNA